MVGVFFHFWKAFDTINHQINYITMVFLELFLCGLKFNYQSDISLLHIDGLVQERRNSIANALELLLSCTNISM